MENKKDPIEEDTLATTALAQKIFEIAAIIDSDPKRITGALGVALGISCGAFGYNPENILGVIQEFYKKTKNLQEELYGHSVPRHEEPLVTKKSDGSSN